MSGSSQDKKPLLNDVLYNRLKRTATIVLPALATLYISLAQIWNFSHVEQVTLTIAALNTAIGGLIQVSKKSYYASGAQYDGVMNVKDDGSKTTASLELNGQAEDIVNKEVVTFKVNSDTGNNPIVKP